MGLLKDTIKADLTTAMKARDELRVSTLRLALAAIMNAEVAGDEAVELSDDQVMGVLQAEAKNALKQPRSMSKPAEQRQQPRSAQSLPCLRHICLRRLVTKN